MQGKGRHRGVDVLRFFAVLYVFFHHIDSYAGSWMTSHAAWARLDELFVVLSLSVFVYSSGLFIGARHARFPDLPTRLSFLRRRLTALWPAYVGALALFLVFDQGGSLTKAEIVQHVLLVQTVVFERFGAELLTLWFVSMIMVFYVLYASLPFRLAGLRSYAVAACLVLVILAVRLRFSFPDARLALYWPVFLAGVWIGRQRGPALPRLPTYLLLLPAALVLALFQTPFASAEPAHFGLLLAFGLLMVLPVHRLALLIERERVLPMLDVFAGRPTYYMYLYHRIVFAAIVLVLGTGAAQPAVFGALLLVGTPIVAGIAVAASRLQGRRRTGPTAGG